MTFAISLGIAEAIGRWVLWAVSTVVNGLVLAVGTALQALSSIFPSLPDVPGPPAGGATALGFIAWVFPWGAAFALIGVLVTAYTAMLGIRIIARWIKLL